MSWRRNALDAKSAPSLLRRTSSVHPVYKTISSGIKSPTEKEISTTDKWNRRHLPDIQIKTESSFLIMSHICWYKEILMPSWLLQSDAVMSKCFERWRCNVVYQKTGNSTAFSDYQISSSFSISHGYDEHNIKDRRGIYLTLTTAKII